MFQDCILHKRARNSVADIAIPGEGEIFPLPSRPALGITQPPTQWVPRHIFWGKAAGAWL
jgi:hypothetical protein